ncbi:MAG: MFS transporter [Armatimonadetes bacterium]|nr:MFS transporter [Armatimonadota bacterium]
MPDDSRQHGLTQQQIAHSLRHFILMGVLWAVYGPNATVGGPVLSGFALKIGLTEAQIGFLASVTGLMGASQLVTSYFTRRIRNKRRFCVTLGFFEITSASLIVTTMLLPQAYRFTALAALLLTAYLLGHTVNPIFNSWLSNIIPSSIRGQYIGRRMMYLAVSAIVYLYLASKWLDMWPGQTGFVTVFVVGWAAGILGYVMMARTPYPRMRVEPAEGLGRAIIEPLRDPTYRPLALFMCTWIATGMMSGAFYSVYMINVLKLPYAQVAIYINITLFMMMIGYRLWGAFAQRFGSKPIEQLLIGPYVLTVAMWVFMTPATYVWLLPIQRMLAGLLWAGIEVANSSLLYKLVPGGRENSSYFANWMTFTAIGAAGGPFIGGMIRQALPEAGVTVAGMSLTPLQVVFAVSTLLGLVPVVLSRFLRETEATSPRYLLGQFRGNLLTYAYNWALYRTGLDEERRARATRALGHSHTPLAVDQLVDALDDVSPQVRMEAARGLGEMRAPEAVEVLTEELYDDESDIRPEAVQALGKIGAPVSVAPLVEALSDEDPRVRVSAAMALGSIGGEEAREALLAALEGDFDKTTFAAVVEGASHLGDLRIIRPALRRLPEFRSPVLRMQILNSVCRVLGEPRHFYRLLMADPVSRAGLRESMTRRIVRLIRGARRLPAEAHEAMLAAATDFRRALDSDDYPAAAVHARRLAQLVIESEAVAEVPHAAAEAVMGYLEGVDTAQVDDEGIIFLLVCVTAIARFLR